MATFTTSTLPQGSHSISAQYAGDSNFTTSTSTSLSQDVQATTATAVASSLNPSFVGQSVTFTATVTSSVLGRPTGNVAFFDGTTQLGTGTLNAQAMATFTASALVAGTHSITAKYAGDANFAASTSTALTQTVADFTVAASPLSQTIAAGQSATITFTVTPVNGSTQTVTLACGTLPPKTTCGFVPPSVTLDGTNSKSSTATIQTMANSALPFSPRPFRRLPGSRIELLAGIWVFAFLSFVWLARRMPRGVAFTCVLLCGLALSLASCSSSGSSSGPSGTPPGTYSISIAASSGGTNHSATVSVVVH
jgi:hypothetical protein